MNAINDKRVINYVTLLYYCKYSPKSLRLIPGVFDLIEIQDERAFCLAAAKVFPVDTHMISGTYHENLKLFEDVNEEYQVLYIKDQLYPQLLRKTAKPPLFLFCQGNVELFNRDCISVVGTRKPTELGVKRAQKLALLLSARGYVVVSGLATGIDTAAHTGAIRAGGKTIAVIGTPLNHYYPKENMELQKRIAIGHLVVSQYPFGHPITRASFPARNYTMSGISRATVVIEAGETSGALIQARQCMEQGRHLFILKNLLDRNDLKWPKKYVEKGAFVIEQVEDVPRALSELPHYKIDSSHVETAALL